MPRSFGLYHGVLTVQAVRCSFARAVRLRLFLSSAESAAPSLDRCAAPWGSAVTGQFRPTQDGDDHRGIYAVETKTWSKPWPEAKVVIREGKLLKAGFEPDRDPSSQALHSARWLQALLEGKTGGTYPVRPVVAIPGWSVDKGLEHGTVCVIEPKDLPSYIDQRTVSLSRREVRLLAAQLSRYIRAMQRTVRS